MLIHAIATFKGTLAPIPTLADNFCKLTQHISPWTSSNL